MWSICWSCKNCLNASEENGGPLSVVSLFGGPYWEISDLIFFTIGSAGFDKILYKNGHFLKLSTIRRYSALLWCKKSAVRPCQGPPGISLGNISSMACVALCVVQTLQCLTYSLWCQHPYAASRFYPLLGVAFVMPLWGLWSSCSIVW